jgi:predicted phage terminase large subunit-like protein
VPYTLETPSPAHDQPSTSRAPSLWTPPPDARPALSLEAFIEAAWVLLEPATPFVPGWHLSLLCEHLEAVSRGELHDLLINVPPGTTKSLTVGVFWPAWEWTWQPWTRWLTASYDDRLALRDAVRTRRLMQSAWYRGQLQTDWRFASDQNVKGYYLNDRMGWRIAISLAGGATGEHAHRIVADDPHHVKRAESELERDKALVIWREVFPSRVLPGGARVVVGQRTHEQDVSADWLAREREQIHHLELQMELDLGPDGEARGPCALTGRSHDERTAQDALLAPERFPAERIRTLKRDLGSYAWSAQYQQRPVPRAGAILDPGLFRATDEQVLAAAQTVRVQFWDTAFSAKQTADHTVAVTLDAETGGLERLWLRSVLRERHDATPDPARPEQPTRLDQALADHIVATRPTLVGIEEAAFRKRAVADMVRRIQKLLRARGVSISVKPIPVDGDKVTRARIVEGRLKAGDLYADHAMAGWTAYAAELAAFPMRKEDDQVDATSGAVTMAIEHVALVVQARELAGLASSALAINRPQAPDPDQAQARYLREMIGRG